MKLFSSDTSGWFDWLYISPDAAVKVTFRPLVDHSMRDAPNFVRPIFKCKVILIPNSQSDAAMVFFEKYTVNLPAISTPRNIKWLWTERLQVFFRQVLQRTVIALTSQDLFVSFFVSDLELYVRTPWIVSTLDMVHDPLGKPWLGQIYKVLDGSILSSLLNLKPRPLRNVWYQCHPSSLLQ